MWDEADSRTGGGVGPVLLRLPHAPGSNRFRANNVSRAGSAILLGLAAALALAGPRRVLGRARADQLRGILPYVVCGAIAYSAVYMISPGYVLSGYLSRFAPLAVFVLDIPLAIAVYLVVGATVRAVELLCEHRARGLVTGQLIAPAVRAGLLVGGLTFLVGFWLQVQVAAIWLLPPNAAAFMKLLGEPPLRGSSLVSNTYIAPLAAYTGEWGYIDPSAGPWKVEATDSGTSSRAASVMASTFGCVMAGRTPHMRGPISMFAFSHRTCTRPSRS